MENFEKKQSIITECFKCGTRYINYFNASPCCKSIVLKVDENGNRSTITFLSSLALPQPHLAVKVYREDKNEETGLNPADNVCRI